jgi:hypothetical protein
MLKHLEVYRVQFGDPNKSHSSDLIAVTNAAELIDAISAVSNRIKQSGSIIDGDIVEVKGLSSTPTLYIAENNI